MSLTLRVKEGRGNREWRKLHNEELITKLLTEYCAGGKIEKNEIGGACDAYGEGERGAQGSGGET